MGLVSWLLGRRKPRATKVDDGLSYVVHGPNRIEVVATPEFYEGLGDEGPVSRESRADMQRVRASVTGVVNQGDATAVCTVIWNMDAFCPRCEEEVGYEDRRCPYCGQKLWNSTLYITLTKPTC